MIKRLNIHYKTEQGLLHRRKLILGLHCQFAFQRHHPSPLNLTDHSDKPGVIKIKVPKAK